MIITKYETSESEVPMKQNQCDKKDMSKDTGKKTVSAKQTVAVAGVALLALLYAATLVAAIADNSSSGTWFRASLFATMALPLLLWIYIWMYGKLTGKRTLANPPSPAEDAVTETMAEDAAAEATVENAVTGTTEVPMKQSQEENDSAEKT